MKKKRTRRKRRIKLRHLLIIGLLIYISSIFINQKKLMNNMKSKKMSLEKEVESLEKDIGDLEKDIENSDSLEFVEKVARDELGMVKPREIIYIDKEKIKNTIFDFFRK